MNSKQPPFDDFFAVIEQSNPSYPEDALFLRKQFLIDVYEDGRAAYLFQAVLGHSLRRTLCGFRLHKSPYKKNSLEDQAWNRGWDEAIR